MARPAIGERAMTATERSARRRERELARIATLEAALRDLLPDAEARLSDLEFKAGYRRSKAEREQFATFAAEQRAKVERARAALEA